MYFIQTLDLQKAIVLSIFWGIFLLSLLSAKIAEAANESIIEVISEHIVIALLVIFCSHYIGEKINIIFDDSSKQSGDEAPKERKGV